MASPRILLLGVGNILYADEGIGVHAARYLERHYTFSDNVTLMEGGTLGKLLMPALCDCDIALIMDAVLGDNPPGTVYYLENDALRKSLGFCDSQHQVDLVDILISCDLIDKRPQTRVVGMEPADWKTMQMELTSGIQEQFPRYISLVLQELEKCGGKAERKA